MEQVGLAILADLGAATAQAAADLPAGPEATWRTYVDTLVALDLGALTAVLSSDLGGPLEGPMRDAQERSLAAVESLLVDVRAAGLVPGDLGALEQVVAVGIVTRPQSDMIRVTAPHRVDRLVVALLAGLQAEATRESDTVGRLARRASR